MSFTRFDRYVERNAQSFIERLQALCRMPSVAARGTGMRNVAEAVEQMMQRAGGGTRLFRLGSGYPIIYAEFGAGAHCFLVYGHYDVQPVGSLSEWTSGPFAAQIIGAKLYARGAANSKGDLVARLAAIEAYQKSFGKLPFCLRYIVEGEDALGSPSLYQFAAEYAELLRAHGAIWDDGYIDANGRLVISLGFKGIAFVELRAHGARTDIHSKWGGIVPNPAWRLVHALATLFSPAGEITVDGYMDHVAPLDEEDLRLLASVELDEEGLKREFRIERWARGLAGQDLVRQLVFGPTCTICGLQTGHTEAGPRTALPGTAVARVDFRLVPNLTPELAINLLREHLDRRGFDDIEISVLARAPVAKSSARSLVARAAAESAAEVYGSDPIIYPLDPASGPVGALCGAVQPPTPVVSFGIGYEGSNPHGPDENIRLEDFIRGIKYFGRVIHQLGRLAQEASAEKESEAAVELQHHRALPMKGATHED